MAALLGCCVVVVVAVAVSPTAKKHALERFLALRESGGSLEGVWRSSEFGVSGGKSELEVDVAESPLCSVDRGMAAETG